MTLPISYFRFYFPEYVLKTRLPPNCATGFLDSLRRNGPAVPSFIQSFNQSLSQLYQTFCTSSLSSRKSMRRSMLWTSPSEVRVT